MCDVCSLIIFRWACWVKIISGTSQLSGCGTCVREGVSNGALVGRGWRWVGTESLGSVDIIWMWLRATTPTKGMMVRQCILQLFSEASQWASLVNASELPAPSGSKMWNSIWAVYEPGSQPSLEIPMKDLAIWLGKQAGVTFTHVARLEEYAAHALAKTAHRSAF